MGMAEYIEREAAIESIMSNTPDAHYPHWYADKIKAIPAADVAPVRYSRWKYLMKQNVAVCTNCSFERDLDANFGNAVSCPNCGAKMDLELVYPG